MRMKNNLKLNKCLDCDRTISKKAKRCKLCAGKIHGKNMEKKKILNYCLNCKKNISKNAKRCMKCAAIKFGKERLNKNNPSWKGGISLGRKYCFDCGKILTNNHSKRCQSCATKNQLKNPKNNYFYINGKSLKPNYCINCKIKINRQAKRCRKCSDINYGKLHTGKNNPCWQGGISFYPYSIKFNKKLKEKIRKRDNYTCQKCYKKQNGRLLDVHHIDYNKRNSKKNNLISLCKSCHTATNNNRDYWYAYFMYKLNEI